MAKYETVIKGQFDEVLSRLHEDIMNSAMSMNLVDESNHASGDTNIAVRVYDKYFMRNGNRASLSLTVVSHENEIFISAIGAGGGQGVIFNFSLGAEDELVAVVQESIERML
ncbi:MAG TPA: DUF6054 family protein [Mobilitalea sp.]|nr:DUF6054 family protein [Mobilitalea sp.]